MKTRDNLLNKYYRGETTLEEEKSLRSDGSSGRLNYAENNIFKFYSEAGSSPEDLEESIFKKLKDNQKRKIRRIWIYGVTSVAASLFLIINIFLGLRTERRNELENEFFVLERALFQASESIQPEGNEEMLVLWVDDNVEIIVN